MGWASCKGACTEGATAHRQGHPSAGCFLHPAYPTTQPPTSFLVPIQQHFVLGLDSAAGDVQHDWVQRRFAIGVRAPDEALPVRRCGRVAVRQNGAATGTVTAGRGGYDSAWWRCRPRGGGSQASCTHVRPP